MVPDEDIALFATGYYGRFGENARWRASEQAARLGGQGDAHGEAEWRRVVLAIDRVAMARRHTPVPRRQAPVRAEAEAEGHAPSGD